MPVQGKRRRLRHRLTLGGIALVAALSVTPAALAARSAHLVKDIDPGKPKSFPHGLTNVGGRLLFAARDRRHGVELWRSDGTKAGTRMIRDINPGGANSHPQDLTSVGRKLFFVADDGTHGYELWRSDGTRAGTRMVKDVTPHGFTPDELTNVHGTLFFATTDSSHGFELWRSDGAKSGTRMVKDINPGRRSSSPHDLENAGGTLFFDADDGHHGDELWRSDGTKAGTKLVKDINPGSAASSNPGGPDHTFTNVGNELFFPADDGTHGFELWRSDGTKAGTQLVKDINAGRGALGPDDLTNVGGTLFFGVLFDLWRSDGTADDTERVKNITPYAITDVRRSLLCFGFEGTSEEDGLWRSDGTPEGTELIKDFGEGSELKRLTNVGGTAFLAAYDKQGRRWELWRSDGTSGGTERVKAFDGNVGGLTNVDGTLYFQAFDKAHGIELWKTTP